MNTFLAQQTIIFLYSILLGGIMGLIYDIFRIYRKCVKSGTISILVQDILYFVIFTFLTFMFLLGQTNGQLRGFCILGIFLGALIYYLTLGIIVLKVSIYIITFVQRIFINPLLKFIIYIIYNIKKFLRFIYKKIKKIIQFVLIYLKDKIKILYNYNRSVFLNKNEISTKGYNDLKEEQKSIECHRKKKNKKKKSKEKKKSFK